MDSIIINASDFGKRELTHFPEAPYGKNLYFFFRQELEIPAICTGNVENDISAYADLKKTTLRHLIPNKRSYYDYIVQKHYKTLAEWAEANGRTVDDILYGVNHIHFDQNREQAYMPLKELLHMIAPNWVDAPQPDADADRFVLIRTKLDNMQALLNEMYAIIQKMN